MEMPTLYSLLFKLCSVEEPIWLPCSWQELPFSREAATFWLDRLYFMWLFTSWPAASADIREISPASTEPATILASVCEFLPGDSKFAPFTPSRFRHAACDANCVPPPIVPTCKRRTCLF